MGASLRASPPCDLADRLDDVGIGPAAADIAAHEFADVVVRVGAALGQQRYRRKDLSGRTVTALQSVMTDKRLLQRVSPPVGGEALDGRHMAALALRGQRQAGQ